MIPLPIASEIDNYAAQLSGFLAAKYVDQALLQGFITVVQTKFYAWILADLVNFKALFSAGPVQVDTTNLALIDLLQILWSKFHHPILKFYQRLHSEMLKLLVEALKSERSIKSKKTDKGLPKPQFRVVEMRKLNEAFVKMTLLASAFYSGVVILITLTYTNPLIPTKYLDELNLESIASTYEITAKEESSEIILQEIVSATQPNLLDFHSTLSYAVFYCLLNLGNLSRHLAQINIAYFQPGKSVSAYYKHIKNGSSGTELANKLYAKPLQYYFKCIGLLPTMHEPYNHIGVIYNALGEKFTAAIWFLRSQFTRDTANTVGKYNLQSLFTKPWLDEQYGATMRKSRGNFTATDVNNILMRVVSDHFYSAAFSKPLYQCKVEADLLEVLFLKPVTSHIVAIPSLVTDHLTLLICFLTMAENENRKEVASKFGSFTAKYFDEYLSHVSSKPIEQQNMESVLRNARLILAFLRKNDSNFCRIHNKDLAPKFADLMNDICETDDDEKNTALELFESGVAPVRSHYFAEDVKFKDFTPIGCQFKDFNDEHLFFSNNIDLLFGSYYYTESGKIPSFLDNCAVQKIHKEMELEDLSEKLQDLIAQECKNYEELMRIAAIVTMVKKVFGLKVFVEDERFVSETIEVFATQKQPRNLTKTPLKAKGKKDKKRAAQQAQVPNVSVLDEASAPESFKEIEQMIIGHAPKLAIRKEGDFGQDLELAEMVDAIVSDDRTKPVQDINASQSTKPPASKVNSTAPTQDEESADHSCIHSNASLQEVLQDPQLSRPEILTSSKVPVHILHPPLSPRGPALPTVGLLSNTPVILHENHFQPAWPSYDATFRVLTQQYPIQAPVMQMPMPYFPPDTFNGQMAHMRNMHMSTPVGQHPHPYPYMVPGSFQGHAYAPNIMPGQDQYWQNNPQGSSNSYPQYQ